LTQTVPVRIEGETLETVDMLVKLGFYKTRSDAIRELTKKGLEAREETKELGKLLKAIGMLDKRGKLDFSGLELERDGFPSASTRAWS
jgi:Arc/MetJ-type ribon-helix-helix transcriptional regulator